MKLPRPVLKYIVAHEIAHISSKNHTLGFWDTLKIICTNYNISKKLLADFKNNLLDNSILL